jgi:hypothetical protein
MFGIDARLGIGHGREDMPYVSGFIAAPYRFEVA